jgi:hypothetical protein
MILTFFKLSIVLFSQRTIGRTENIIFFLFILLHEFLQRQLISHRGHNSFIIKKYC